VSDENNQDPALPPTEPAAETRPNPMVFVPPTPAAQPEPSAPTEAPVAAESAEAQVPPAAPAAEAPIAGPITEVPGLIEPPSPAAAPAPPISEVPLAPPAQQEPWAQPVFEAPAAPQTPAAAETPVEVAAPPAAGAPTEVAAPEPATPAVPAPAPVPAKAAPAQPAPGVPVTPDSPYAPPAAAYAPPTPPAGSYPPPTAPAGSYPPPTSAYPPPAGSFAPPAAAPAAPAAPDAAWPPPGTGSPSQPEQLAALRTRGAALAIGAPRFINGRYLAGVASHLGVSVVTTLIVTLLTIGMLVIDAIHLSAGSGDSGSSSSSSDSAFSIGTAFRLLFGWLISLTLGGNVHGHAAITAGSTSVDLGIALHGAPLLLTAAIAVMTVWAGIRIEKLTPTTSWVWRAITGAATGLVAAGILSILAATLGHGTITPPGDAGFSGSITLSAGGPGVFLTGWLVLGLAAIVGRQVGAWGGWRRIVTAAPAVVRDLTIWGSALAVVFGVVGIVLGMIAGVREHQFLNLLLTFPLWLGQVIVWLVTFGHFGSVNISTGGLADALDAISGTGDGGASDLDQGLNVFSITGDGGGFVWVLFALAVLTLLWAGLRIGIARSQRPAGFVQRGAFVVVATAVALLVPLLLSDIRIGITGASHLVQAIGAAFHGSLANAGWAFLVFAAAAVLVDVVATFLAPLVAVGLPWLVSAVGFGVLRDEGDRSVPMTPTAKKASIWAGSVVGGLAVIAALFFGVVAAVNGLVFTPEEPVAAYLALIAKGDVKDAAAAQTGSDGSVPKVAQLGSDLSAKAKPTKTISDVKILSSSTSSDFAQVKISYRLDGSTYKDTVEAEKTGHGLFDHWVVASPLTSSVLVKSGSSDSAKATVGGASVTIEDGESEVTVFPGVYSVAGKGSTLLTSKPVDVTASKSGASATLKWSYTKAATKQVQKTVDEIVDQEYMNGGEYASDLESATEEKDPDSNFDVKWKRISYPVITLNSDGTFVTSKPGSATATWTDFIFNEQTFDISQPTKTSTEKYYLDGTTKISGDKITVDQYEAATDPAQMSLQSQVQSSGS